MSISAVGNPTNLMPQLRPQQTAAGPNGAVAAVGPDSDGDNDGSKGGTVEIRA
ncbi:MAG: hypothetical protein ACLPVY_18605 [Acidimicrobiia bacterium]